MLGILSFHSDSHTLKVRDEWIGWTTIQRASKREHLVNMNVCAPSQPFGYNRLGGKFISLASLDLIKLWERKYRTKVVGITTTSLHGSQSQYNGMGRYWKHLGTTSGTMFYKPKRDEYLFWRNWLANNYPELYDDLSSRTSPTQGYLAAIYRILGIGGKDYFHNH